MWSYRLVAPYTFERQEVSEPSPESLADGQVLLDFLAAGICGSDLPGFRGTQGKLPGDTGCCAAEMTGFPIHEIVGEVLASRHPDHRPGERVVGWASGFDGLMGRVIADGSGLVPYDPALPPELAVGLRNSGRGVVEFTAYRIRKPPQPDEGLVVKIMAAPPDAMLFSSGLTARNFVDMLTSERALLLAGGAAVVSIGPVTTAALEEVGIAITVEARPTTPRGF